MRRLTLSIVLTIGLTAVVLGGALVLAAPPAADFQSGWQAHQKGDYAAAQKDWQPLADRSHARSQYQLAVMYEEGDGVAQDHVAAAKWFRS